MTPQETIKAMPLEDRTKFFRAMLEVAEAGRKAGIPAKEWGALAAEVINQQEKK